MNSQNQIKNRYGFSTDHTLSFFVPLVVPWDPILDPDGKSEILVGPH